jgi:hypothetical protein
MEWPPLLTKKEEEKKGKNRVMLSADCTGEGHMYLIFMRGCRVLLLCRQHCKPIKKELEHTRTRPSLSLARSLSLGSCHDFFTARQLAASLPGSSQRKKIQRRATNARAQETMEEGREEGGRAGGDGERERERDLGQGQEKGERQQEKKRTGDLPRTPLAGYYFFYS